MLSEVAKNRGEEMADKKVLTCKGCGLVVETSCIEYRCPMCGVHVTECTCCQGDIKRISDVRRVKRVKEYHGDLR